MRVKNGQAKPVGLIFDAVSRPAKVLINALQLFLDAVE